MENYQNEPMEVQQQNLFNFGIEQQGLDYLKSSAKWEKFMAIVSLIWISLCILLFIFGGSAITALMMSRSMQGLEGLEGNGGAALAGGFMTGLFIFYALLLSVLLIPNIYRLKFANNCIKAIANSDTELLTKSFKNLRVYSTFWGILTIIVLSIYAFGLIFALIGFAVS
ncbi:MAG: hypothetical protein ACOVMM_02115 [Chitinophagaceae bacterium]